jgi:hypothetical protein
MDAETEKNETFTDFMIRCMESEHDVSQCVVIIRRSDGTFGYKTFNQEVMDTLGMLRFTAMSVEHETIKIWQGEED